MSSRVIVKIPKMSIPIVEVEYTLIEVTKLVPHEEIVEGRLKDLIETIVREDAVDMPLVAAPIPSTDKFLIVDGHHRWAALIELKCRYAPCVLIDYFNERVVLKTWYPAIDGSIDLLLHRLSTYGLNYRKLSCTEDLIREDVLANVAFIARGFGDECVIIGRGVEEQKIVSKLISEMNVQGAFNLFYYGELEDAIKDLVSGEIRYVFLRKTVSKAEVMEAVKRGEVYPPKTTRHILPFIPAKTYVKLNRLC